MKTSPKASKSSREDPWPGELTALDKLMWKVSTAELQPFGSSIPPTDSELRELGTDSTRVKPLVAPVYDIISENALPNLFFRGCWKGIKIVWTFSGSYDITRSKENWKKNASLEFSEYHRLNTLEIMSLLLADTVNGVFLLISVWWSNDPESLLVSFIQLW